MTESVVAMFHRGGWRTRRCSSPPAQLIETVLSSTARRGLPDPLQRRRGAVDERCSVAGLQELDQWMNQRILNQRIQGLGGEVVSPALKTNVEVQRRRE